MSAGAGPRLRTRRLLGARTLVYFYRRRLRAHGTQELLAGVGIAAAVALVLASGISQGSIAGSTRKVLRAVIGPANLQLRARGPEGFPETLLAPVEAIPGVERAAPLLERSVRVQARDGRSASVYLAGADASLGVLNGFGRTLPLTALTPGTLALSDSSARALRLRREGAGAQRRLTVLVGGASHTLPLSAVLGSEAVGVLASARVGVMPLATMQQLLGQPGRVTRILVQSAAGQEDAVARGLQRIARGRLTVSGAEQDISQLQQALRPSGQASALFAIIGALLGFLLAFNAILLTVPERRQAIADLRLSGTRRSAIVQLTLFQGLCLGAAATAVGLGLGYLLSRWVFHQSTGYLSEAFSLSGGSVVPPATVLLTAAGGALATCLASAMPLLDLRRAQPPDAIYIGGGQPGNTLVRGGRGWLSGASLVLLALASLLYALAPGAALIASVALALATVLAVPVAFAGVLAGARALSQRAPRMSTLAIALGGVRGTTVRSIALAATGAVALFGSVALGGARSDLLGGIRGFAHAYAADAPIWVGEPDDNQAVGRLAGDGRAPAIARVPGVASVSRFQGGFVTLGPRRVWLIARPPGGASNVLASQTVGGAHAARIAEQRLAETGSVAVSEQIASELHTGVGDSITLPTPSGAHSYRVAALTSNLAWSPGVVFMSSGDYTSAWGSAAPSALAVRPAPDVPAALVRDRIARALGPSSGLQTVTAAAREARIDALTGEGLSQLGIISTLLVLAAIMALAAALASSINQRRSALAGLRLAGAPSSRLRRIVLVEASLVLSAGCLTGALAGVYGQFVIDAYLRHVTGFPVAAVGASLRPLEILAVVLAAALAAVAVPAWLASNVPPALALAEE
ncbi:MAG TPA: FtsX-like permease family protein [Solirubrobacteraceae bacterium]|jgi:putative ABC transport system permease protein|nr:FtsX-like permease family protein [Solirubrobacteraceae bacterium]